MDERSDYAVLISLMMREEAEVVAAALRADGIDAFLGNTNHAYFDWTYTVALGGLQVMAPRAKLAEAKQALRERIRENADAYPEERVARRDRWKLWLIIGLYMFGLVAAGSHNFDEVRNSALFQIEMQRTYGEVMQRDCARNPDSVFMLQSGTEWREATCEEYMRSR